MSQHTIIWCLLGTISGCLVMLVLMSAFSQKKATAVNRYTKTFNSLIAELGISEEQGHALMNEALDQVDFCSIVNKRYGIQLTLKEVDDIYTTAPLID